MLNFSQGISNSALIFQLANKDSPGVSQWLPVWLDFVIIPTHMQHSFLYFTENKTPRAISS